MDDLNTIINREPESRQTDKKIKSFLSLPKAIFLILGVVLLIELIYAVRVLMVPVSISKPVNRVVAKQNVGKISLVSPKKNYRLNETVRVSAVINTGGSVLDGVDLIIHYDPKILEATPAGLIQGKVLDDYPTLAIDKNKGIISVSGISNVKKGFKGSGLFAALNLRTKAAGKSSLTIEFQGKGVTTDSNLVEVATSKDILEQVDNLELNVQ